MLNKKIFSAFLLIGSSALVFGAGTQYDKIISPFQKSNIEQKPTTPLKITQYEKWSNENLIFLKSLENKNNPLLQNIETAKIIHNEQSKNQQFLLDINEIEDISDPTVKRLYKIFNNDKRKVFDYVYFNHIVDCLSISNMEDKNLPFVLNRIDTSIPNNIGYRDRILNEYRTSTSNIMAIELLYKKYTDLYENKELSYELAKLNSIQYDENDNIHALLSFYNNTKEKNFILGSSLDDLLYTARAEAFYHVSVNTTVLKWKKGTTETLWEDPRFEKSQKDFQIIHYLVDKEKLEYKYETKQKNNKNEYDKEMSNRYTLLENNIENIRNKFDNSKNNPLTVNILIQKLN